MRDEPPEVAYTERITGTGALHQDGIAYPVQRFVLERKRYDVESEWNFHAFARGERWGAAFPRGIARVSFAGEDEAGKTVHISALHFRLLRGDDYYGTTQLVDVGKKCLQGRCSFQAVTVHLWPTPMAEPEVEFLGRSWTGELKPMGRGQTSTAREVVVTIGQTPFRFSLHYDWEDVVVGGQRSTVRIPRATLSARLRVGVRSKAIETLCESLATELEDLTRLLSFLSRRHVRWSRIEVVTKIKVRDQRDYEDFARIHGSVSTNHPLAADPLLVPGRMPVNWLEQLLTSYRKLRNREAVSAAVIYLLAAHTSRFVDGTVANAYTAFEAMLNALSEPRSEYTLSTARFDALASQMRGTIRDFAAHNNVPDEAREALIRKVPELHRRPLVERALEYFERSEIRLGEFWPNDVPDTRALGSLFRRRNLLIHGGHLGAVHQASIDAERLIGLTERMLLNALGVPQEWEHPFARREAAYLATVPEPVPD